MSITTALSHFVIFRGIMSTGTKQGCYFSWIRVVDPPGKFEISQSIWEIKSGPHSKTTPVPTKQELSKTSIFISSDHETSKLRNSVTEIVVKRNPLEMLQPCPVLTMKPIKSATLEEHFYQSREQALALERSASNTRVIEFNHSSTDLAEAFPLSNLCCLSWTLQFLILTQFQRDPSVAGATLRHSIPRKTADGSRRKKTRRLAKFTSFHFLQRNIRPQNCQPSVGSQAPSNRPRISNES